MVLSLHLLREREQWRYAAFRMADTCPGFEPCTFQMSLHPVLQKLHIAMTRSEFRSCGTWHCPWMSGAWHVLIFSISSRSDPWRCTHHDAPKRREPFSALCHKIWILSNTAVSTSSLVLLGSQVRSMLCVTWPHSDRRDKLVIVTSNFWQDSCSCHPSRSAEALG